MINVKVSDLDVLLTGDKNISDVYTFVLVQKRGEQQYAVLAIGRASGEICYSFPMRPRPEGTWNQNMIEWFPTTGAINAAVHKVSRSQGSWGELQDRMKEAYT